MLNTKFKVDYSKDLSKCQKCMQAIPKHGIRFVKQASYNSYINIYYHINCLFKQFQLVNISTGLIESSKDIENFENISEYDQNYISSLISILNKQRKYKTLDTPDHVLLKRIGTLIENPKVSRSLPALLSNVDDSDSDSEYETTYKYSYIPDVNMDDKFDTFIRICNKIALEPSEEGKTSILKGFLLRGSDGRSFKGDLKLFIRMLLPNYKQQAYDLNTTKLIKLFSIIFQSKYEDMMKTLFNKKGDVAKTIRIYFRLSNNVQSLKRPQISLFAVESYLNELSEALNEEHQIEVLSELASNCTLNELEMIIRLIKKDIRINMMLKSILNSVAVNGYAAFGLTGNLDLVLHQADRLIKTEGKPGVIWLKNGKKQKINLNKFFKN